MGAHIARTHRSTGISGVEANLSHKTRWHTEETRAKLSQRTLSNPCRALCRTPRRRSGELEQLEKLREGSEPITPLNIMSASLARLEHVAVLPQLLVIRSVLVLSNGFFPAADFCQKRSVKAELCTCFPPVRCRQLPYHPHVNMWEKPFDRILCWPSRSFCSLAISAMACASDCTALRNHCTAVARCTGA